MVENTELSLDVGTIFDKFFGREGGVNAGTTKKQNNNNGSFFRDMGSSFTKSLGGFFKKAGVIGTLLNQSLEVSKKMLNFMGESSAALKATNKIFGQAFKLFFKPFGDFLSALLRPLAINFLKIMIRWNKFFDDNEIQKKTKEITTVLEDKLGRELTEVEKLKVQEKVLDDPEGIIKASEESFIKQLEFFEQSFKNTIGEVDEITGKKFDEMLNIAFGDKTANKVGGDLGKSNEKLFTSIYDDPTLKSDIKDVLKLDNENLFSSIYDDNTVISDISSDLSSKMKGFFTKVFEGTNIEVELPPLPGEEGFIGPVRPQLASFETQFNTQRSSSQGGP